MQFTTDTFETADGHHLFARHWAPDTPPRAELVIVHGYAEHSGRYEHVAEFMTGRGYAVHALDLRGHGQSDGDRALVRSFAPLLDDVDLFLSRVRERAEGRPIFLLGHSMGGTTVTLDAATRRPDVRGLVISAAVLETGTGGIWRSLMARLMIAIGRVVPKLGLRALASDTVSRDPKVVALYDSDPLNYRGKIPAGTVGAMMRAVRAIDSRMPAIALPILILHGTADALTDPEGSRRLYEHVGSKDKTLKLYDGLFHEILNEPEQRDVMEDVVTWMDARCERAGAATGEGDAAL